MKKLNRKGFTLIELLAVIVILAIILVVTVPNIINSINDARVSSLHNLTKSVAETYDTAFAQDLVATTETNKLLGNIPASIGDNWVCIGSVSGTKGNGDTVDLKDVLGLSDTDVTLTGDEPSDSSLGSITTSNCSAIRIHNGSTEVILVATDTGKFAVAGNTVYAYSKNPAGGKNASTTE